MENMLKYKIGIAISVYDKIDHLATNVNIIRKNWNSHNNAFISVCCNDIKSFDKVRSLDINAITSGKHDLASTPKPYRRLRIFDCIRNSLLNCEADYIVHYHADAYVVDSESLTEIIDVMEKNNYDVAYRGKGIDYRNPKNICGDVDDHFLILKRSSMLNNKVFNVNYDTILKFLHAGNPETLISKLIDSNYSRENIYHYSDMFENEVGTSTPDPFYPDNLMHRAMNPYNFDNKRSFLHFGNVEREFVVNNLTSRGVKSNLICV